MAPKTITLKIDACERLRRAKWTPPESFSEVVRRLPMSEGANTAGQYPAPARERGALLTREDAATIAAFPPLNPEQQASGTPLRVYPSADNLSSNAQRFASNSSHRA
jgi:hypothetical protein